MSGGEPSSIKQKPSCAADLPILEPEMRKGSRVCVFELPVCGLVGAERKDLIGDFQSPYTKNTVPEKPYFDT